MSNNLVNSPNQNIGIVDQVYITPETQNILQKKRKNKKNQQNTNSDEETLQTNRNLFNQNNNNSNSRKAIKQNHLLTNDIINIELNGMPVCCKLNCLQQFHHEQILNFRKTILSLNNKDRKSFIANNTSIEQVKYGSKTKFNVESIQVCQIAFLFCYPVSKSALYSKPTYTRTKNPMIKFSIIQFLESLASWNNFMPDNNQIHLPYTNHIQVYNLYQLQSEDEFKCSNSYFNTVWRDRLPHIKARKSIRFSKCGKCVHLSERLAIELNTEIKLELKKQLDNHIQRMYLDREIYAKNIDFATKNPTKLISIAIDGADFQRYGLPYFHQKTKDTDKGYSIPIRTVGVKIHGQGDIIFTFNSNLPSGSSSTIHCIHESLSFMKQKYDCNDIMFPRDCVIQVYY